MQDLGAGKHPSSRRRWSPPRYPARRTSNGTKGQIVTFFADEQNRRTIEEMREADVELPNPDHGGRCGPLKDLNFVFTGRLERWSRSDAESLVESLSGRTSSNVSGNTDYVVAGPDAGSKLDEARERNVPVIDEEEFESFLRVRGADVQS